MFKSLLLLSLINLNVQYIKAQSWSEVGTNPLNSNVITMCSDSLGNIYAGGNFTDVNGIHYVVKWNGKSWSILGTGANALKATQQVRSLCSDGKGNIYATGNFNYGTAGHHVVKWNGSTWSDLGLNPNNAIWSVYTDRVGNLYAAGDFMNANYKLCSEI